MRVFDMNNRVLRSLPVRARHHARALLKMVPWELALSVIGAAGVALLVLWLTPRLLAWRAQAAAGPPPSAFDAASGMHSSAPGRIEL